MRVINLSAGPSALPEPVLKRLKEGVLEYGESSVGIFELGHRTKLFDEVIEESKLKLKRLLNISDDFDVLFCTGGATQQFSMVPLNINTESDCSAGYIISGFWAKSAHIEASKFRNTQIISTTEDLNFSKLPEIKIDDENLSYLHFTSNNTIYGTQFLSDPVVPAKIPLVCDSSSDILSRVIDINKYSLIYSGAQKNLGTAGVTIVIVRKNLVVEKSNLATNLNYMNYLKYKSNFNTPPVSAIISVYEILKWVEEEGGILEMEKRSILKSKEVYRALDEVEVFSTVADKNSRSRVNITFTGRTKEIEEAFIKYAKERNFIGLEGHRLVGGLRVSFYNSISVSEASSFSECIRDFSKTI